MIGEKYTLIKDFKTYLRLAKQAQTREERDYYITCAKLALRRAGYDVSNVPEDPNLALDKIESFLSSNTSVDLTDFYNPPAVPYSELLAGIEGL